MSETFTRPCDLTDLLARLEAAEGPGIVLETQIAIALRDGAEGYPNFPLGSFRDGFVQANMGRHGWSVGWRVPPYTASLDAALALVERVLPGWGWAMSSSAAGPFGVVFLPGERMREATHKTPALALLCALVKALIAKEVQS
jgi:hypothetical protein